MTREHTYPTEEAARLARRALIVKGSAVSLLAFDPARDLYVFDEIVPASAAHLAPSACYVCGQPEHPPAERHTYWPNAEAARYFARQPEGVLPSMSATETLDPREAAL